MKIVVYIIFWAIIPIGCIYFRIIKKIKTGFAIGLVLTSFFLGYITSNTFTETYEDRLIRVMNDNDYEQAEKVMVWILQRSPEDLVKIDKTRIINIVKYDKLKNKLGSQYKKTAIDIIDKCEVIKTEDCNNYEKNEKCLERQRHVLRLLKMAEATGIEVGSIEKDISNRLANSEKIITMMKQKCR